MRTFFVSVLSPYLRSRSFMGSDEVDVKGRVLQFPQVAVDLVHPAVDAALRGVELLHDELHHLLSPFALPDLLEGILIDVAHEEPVVAEEGAAGPHAAARVDVRPERDG